MESSSKKRKAAAAAGSATSGSVGGTPVAIELLESFEGLRKAWPKDMVRLLDPSLPGDRRSELWEMMCEEGDALRQRFAWAIPDERALKIIKHFSPIVEIGSGLGYWAKLLRDRGADINAYDKAAGAPDDDGNTNTTKNTGVSKKKTARDGDAAKSSAGRGDEKGDLASGDEDGDDTPSFWIEVKEGGPDVLEEPCNKKRSLLLCYPDDFEGETGSLGLRCLHAFEGDVIIHVGELFGDSVSMTPGQSPWGRTTSQECQEELVSKFHCILKVPLPSWPHARDTLTVWKRHSFCAIRYDDDGDGDGDGDSEESGRSDDDNEVGKSKVDDEGRGAEATGSEKNTRKGVARSAGGEAPGGSVGDDSDQSGDDDNGTGSDDFGSVDGLPIGLPDVDMYGFVPLDEQMQCAQAAPCVRLLLDTQQ